MRRFLRKRWHGIPVGIIATLLLVGAVAAGAFVVISGTITFTVTEPLVVRYHLGCGNWTDVTGDFTLSMDASPGQSQDVWLMLYNSGGGDLTIGLDWAVTQAPSGHWGALTVTSGYANGSALLVGDLSVAAGECPTARITVALNGTADEGTYKLAVNFTRS